MPAYSFKERFVPMVKARTKTQTIRAFRSYPARIGQVAHLFYGMRTSNCVKLGAHQIVSVKVIYISDTGGVALIDTNWINPGLVAIIRLYGKIEIDKFPSVQWLSKDERDELAWQDGFRQEHDADDACGCFDIMCRWWKLTHPLPFIGNLIKWDG